MKNLSWIRAMLFIAGLGFFLPSAGPAMALESTPGNTTAPCVVLEDNVLYGNNLSGIRVRGDVPVVIDKCEIHSNGRAGVYLDSHSNATVTGCDVFRNGMGGVNIDKAAVAVVEGSRIYENENGGVRIQRGPGEDKATIDVTVADSRIYRNKRGGIRAMLPPEATLRLQVFDSAVFRNWQAGIRVENDTTLTARGNDVFGNGTAGIVSYVSVVPPRVDIYQNRVSFNGTAGIHVVNGISGPIGIRNNWVFNNERSGILCGLWSDPDEGRLDVAIVNNTVVSNGNSDQGVGIRNDSGGKALIINNIVAYSYTTGIRTRECYDESFNLLFANGDIGNCCEDPRSAPYWIERTQFAGCPERGKGDLLCDPMFVDPDNYNFSLQDGSPAIDAGSDKGLYDDVSFPPSRGTRKNDMGATGGPYADPKGVSGGKSEYRNTKYETN
jgi:parallel beta-helix repeat protein